MIKAIEKLIKVLKCFNMECFLYDLANKSDGTRSLLRPLIFGPDLRFLLKTDRLRLLVYDNLCFLDTNRPTCLKIQSFLLAGSKSEQKTWMGTNNDICCIIIKCCT